MRGGVPPAVPLPYEIDLDRPPRRLGPRRSVTTRMAIGWGVCVVLWGFLLYLVVRGLPPLLFLVPALTVTGGMAYFQARLVNDGSALARHFVESGFNPSDLDASTRVVDRQELSALRRLQRRAITRVEYERIVAFRHLAHGEISEPEYRQILRYLAEQEPRPAADVARPPGEWRGRRND